MEIVEPPTSASIEEKCGTDNATNTTTAIITVRDITLFHVKSITERWSCRPLFIEKIDVWFAEKIFFDFVEMF